MACELYFNFKNSTLRKFSMLIPFSVKVVFKMLLTLHLNSGTLCITSTHLVDLLYLEALD
jgi:hypothetical protein